MARWVPEVRQKPGYYSLHNRGKAGPPTPASARRDYLPPTATEVKVRHVTKREVIPRWDARLRQWGEVTEEWTASQVIVPHFVPEHLKGKRLKRFMKKHPKGRRVEWHPDHFLDRPDLRVPGVMKLVRAYRQLTRYK